MTTTFTDAAETGVRIDPIVSKSANRYELKYRGRGRNRRLFELIAYKAIKQGKSIVKKIIATYKADSKTWFLEKGIHGDTQLSHRETGLRSGALCCTARKSDQPRTTHD